MPIPTRIRMPTTHRVIIRRPRDLTRQLLEGLALGLGDQQRGKDAAQHEEGEDLHDVVEPGRGVGGCGRASGAEGPEDDLGDDGADFARGGREAVRGGAVAGREAFTGDDEGCSVGA